MAGLLMVCCAHAPSMPPAASGPPASVIDDADSVEVDLEELGIEFRAIDIIDRSVEVSATPDRVRVTLAGGILFDSGEATLKPEADPILAELVEVAQREGVGLEVEGHTDDVGEEPYNLDLSRRRAATVSSWLSEHGVEAGRIEERGYGELWPRVPNDSEQNRALNRRVEVVFTGLGGSGMSRESVIGHWAGQGGHLVLRDQGEYIHGTYDHDAGAIVYDAPSKRQEERPSALLMGAGPYAVACARSVPRTACLRV